MRSTGRAAAWTGTPPTSWPRTSRAPPGSPHRVGSSAWQRSRQRRPACTPSPDSRSGSCAAVTRSSPEVNGNRRYARQTRERGCHRDQAMCGVLWRSNALLPRHGAHGWSCTSMRVSRNQPISSAMIAYAELSGIPQRPGTRPGLVSPRGDSPAAGRPTRYRHLVRPPDEPHNEQNPAIPHRPSDTEPAEATTPIRQVAHAPELL